MNTARILENIVPKQNAVYVRRGSKTVSTIPGPVETLADYDSGPVQKLIAAAEGSIYSVPILPDMSNNPGVLIKSGFTSARWQTVMMANAADDANLVMVNGKDGIWVYNGTTLTEATASTANKTVDNVINYKGRLWFTKVGDSTVYYGEVLSNSPGALTEFPIGPVLRNGGEIIAINSLSMDGGSGPDDYLVLVSSRGEIVVYSGIDPADDMRLVGVFKGAKPLGRRCLIKSGSDLIFYGTNGPQLLTHLFLGHEGVDSLSLPVRTEFENALLDKSSNFGWDLISYPQRGWILFNVPRQGMTFIDQYVLNLESQAWFKITGWNALCWATHQGDLYFGAINGRVIRSDYGGNDDTRPISFDFMQSWYQYNTAMRKKFNMAQVTIESNATPKIAVDMNVDYREEVPTSQPGFPPGVIVSPWDVSPWDTSPWSGTELYFVNSFGLANIGYVGALRYRGQLKDSTHSLYGYRIAFESGEFL